MISHIYVLHYKYPWKKTWIGTTIGYYSSRERAEQAIIRFQSMPGFENHPEGFEIKCVKLDEDQDAARGLFPPFR
jgi:hypothetical protein